MNKKIKINQALGLTLEIRNPHLRKDNIEVWSEVDSKDPQVIYIERKHIKVFCDALLSLEAKEEAAAAVVPEVRKQKPIPDLPIDAKPKQVKIKEPVLKPITEMFNWDDYKKDMII